MADIGEIDTQMRVAFDAGDYAAVATLMLQSYGSEIQAFLASRLRSPVDADDAFSMFAEDLWVGLPAFAWRCGPRGWAYVVARNAANRLLRSPHQRKQHKLTLPERENLSVLIAQIRSATQAHRRTEVKAAIQTIRERLDPDDQMLLVLRVDKGMQFRELALVMNDGDLPDGRMDEETARLRKRFERVKTQIREIARAEGLLDKDKDE